VQEVIVNQRTGHLVDGHLRCQLAAREGAKTIPVKYVDLSEDEEALVLSTLDPIAAMATTDKQKLDELFASIETENADVLKMLDDIAEKERLEYAKRDPVDAEPQIDRAAELNEKWQVKTGDLWQIGEHKLLCGDSTKREDVERVMAGEKARVIFTDPPYGIGKEIINDNLKREDLIDFYKSFTASMLDFVIVNAYVFVWGYFDGLSNYWQEVIKPRGDCNFRNFIVWKKRNIQGRNAEEFRQFPEEYEAALLYIFGQPFQNGPWSASPNSEYYPEIFEPIRAYLDGEREKMGWDIPTCKKIVGHSELSSDHWFGRSQWAMPTCEVYEKFQEASRGDAFRKDYDELRKDYDELRKDYDELRGYFDNTNGFTDVWEFNKLTIDSRHPTVKPVEVCERGIISTSQDGEIVLDVFLGSGSTMIACQNLNRKCRAIEISPNYCAVILERMTTAFPELEIKRVT